MTQEMRSFPLIDLDGMLDGGPDDYYDAITITVGELVADDIINLEWFDFDCFDQAQRARLWSKFMGRFEWREIGIIPVGRWMARVLAKLNEIMPKYKPLYQALADGITPMTAVDEWHKSRDVFSQFPQTALGGSDVDYATSGNDREYETVRDYGMLDVGERISEYNDVDVLILNELEPLFCSISSTTLAYM